MWPTILGLLALGALLLFTEVFIPGLIVGACGVVSLIAAVVLSYVHYGVQAGTWLLVALLIAGSVALVAWLRFLPGSWVGRRWTLHAVGAGIAEPPRDELLAATGHALTTLRPAGAALLGSRRVDVVAESEMIEAGEPVRVVRVEGTRVVVRRVEA